jgi:hypothetical protein
MAAGPNAHPTVQNIAGLVKPGGWIQFVEATNTLSVQEGPVMHDFVSIMKDCFKAMNAQVNVASELKGWLEKDGFVDAGEKVVEMKMGAANKNPVLAKQGVYSTCAAAAGLAGFAKSKCPPFDPCGFRY